MKKNQRKTSSGHLISHGDIALNRRVRYDYDILETIEAGLMLTGSEVKSLRLGLANLGEAYAGPKDGRLFILNMTIGEYPNAPPSWQHAPKRPRALLVKKREQARLIGAVTRDRLTIAPLKLYFDQRGRAKLLIGLARGKKQHDKRETIKQREWQRRKGAALRGEE